uniref:Uncharacterized protein n=1 Tax=Triticum urartu TaxID=4572 RepID=A0A8R7PS97_TRIUA
MDGRHGGAPAVVPASVRETTHADDHPHGRVSVRRLAAVRARSIRSAEAERSWREKDLPMGLAMYLAIV